MRIKKRKKASRFRGSMTHARGFKKKARGSGHRGGFGMSGSENQKKTLVINLFGNEYFGKDKTLRRGPVAPKLRFINLQFINDNIASLVKQGIAKDNKGSYDLSLKGYKVLGDGEIKLKLVINASAASQSAIEKVKKAGGEIKLPQKKEIKAEKVEKTVKTNDVKQKAAKS